MSVLDYSKYDTKSIIRQVPNKNLGFPSIFICNPNNYATPAALAYLKEFYLRNYGENFTSLDEIYSNLSFDDAFNWPFYNTFSPDFNQMLMKSFSYSLEDVLITCEFNSKPCNLSWFDLSINPLIGVCFQFNSGRLNGASESLSLLEVNQSATGLYIEIFTGIPDGYLNSFVQQVNYTAVNIYVAEPGHMPLDKVGHPIGPGIAASFALKLTQYNNLPEPYTNCQETSSINTEIARKMRNANMTYDRFSCYSFCFNLYAFYESGCYSFNYPNIFQFPLCKTRKQENSNEESSFEHECEKMCPSECEERVYDYQASFSDFPTLNYAYKLINDRREHFTRLYQTDNITYDMLKKSVTSLFFYYDSLLVNKIDEAPSLVLLDLIGNIGGLFGVFTGLSVLSTVEIIDIAINVFVIIFF